MNFSAFRVINAFRINFTGDLDMKAFNHNASKPKYLDKHQKAFEVILIAFWCVIFPAISAICCSLNGQKPIFKSLSYIAYREKHMGLVLFYGFLFVAGFILSMKMCLDAGQYSKQLKYLFLGLSLISATILTAGMSVPWIEVEGELAEKYKRLREIHNNVATIGFIMFFVTEVLFFITTLLRNPKQGMISVGMLAYVLMTSVIMLKLANLKGIVEHPYPISSIAQIHVFCSIGFTMTIQYFLMRLMPNTRIEMSEAAD